MFTLFQLTSGTKRNQQQRSLKHRCMSAVLPVLIGLVGAQATANELLEVRYENVTDGGDFIFTLAESADAPVVFMTDEPPRAVIELTGTHTELPASPIVLASDPVRSYTTISDGQRTRIIVDLTEASAYEVDAAGNQVVLHLSTRNAVASVQPDQAPVAQSVSQTNNGANNRASTTAAGNTVAASDSSDTDGPGTELVDIDFRRTANGGGRLILDLSDKGVSSAVNERGNRLLVDLFNVNAPDSLQQTLDVMDFATPVMRISTEESGSSVRTTLTIRGDFTHSAFAEDDSYIIEVIPVAPPVEQTGDSIDKLFQNRDYAGDEVTFNFQDIPVRSVLQLIADVSDLNIVVSDSVSGNVTLRLTNVPWDQALDLVLDTKNLDKRKNGNVIWVAPAGEIAAREQQLLQAQQDKTQLEPLRTGIINVSYAQASELAELIESASESNDDQGLLSSRGSVSVDERTNTLLITDTSDRLEEIQSLISQLDRPVRQVLIESRIVIANDDFSHELGVRFGVTATGEAGNGDVFTTSGTINATDQQNNLALRNRLANGLGGSSLPNFIDDPINGNGILAPSLDNRLNVNLPVTSPAGSLGFSVLAADYLLDLELSALESEGRGETVSTPRVVTANQAEAFIQQGVEIPFEQSTSSGATSIQFREAVLELRATPLITPDNRVQLTLSIKQDTVGEIFPTAQGGSVPSIDTTELSTRVLVENGQTIVLGGIFQEDKLFTNEKVPLLGDVPVLGALFRRRGNTNNKNELLIFITPTILDERIAERY